MQSPAWPGLRARLLGLSIVVIIGVGAYASSFVDKGDVTPAAGSTEGPAALVQLNPSSIPWTAISLRSEADGLSAIAALAPRDLFMAGYLEFDGPARWADRFAHNVLSCEANDWGTWYSNGFVTRAQFTHRSWSIASSRTGLTDPANPYHVGAAVAVWTNLILAEGSHPGSDAGWPVCFWR